MGKKQKHVVLSGGLLNSVCTSVTIVYSFSVLFRLNWGVVPVYRSNES